MRPSFQAHGLAGIDRVVHRLQMEINKIKGASLRGLIRAAIEIRRDMDDSSPLIPVDIGNLRASFFVATSDGSTPDGGSPQFKPGPGTTGRKLSDDDVARLSASHSTVMASAKAEAAAFPGQMVKLGFTAYYAVFVHEMMGGVNWSRPGSGPKFFQAALRRNSAKVLDIIRQEATIRG